MKSKLSNLISSLETAAVAAELSLLDFLTVLLQLPSACDPVVHFIGVPPVIGTFNFVLALAVELLGGDFRNRVNLHVQAVSQDAAKLVFAPVLIVLADLEAVVVLSLDVEHGAVGSGNPVLHSMLGGSLIDSELSSETVMEP